MTGPTVLVVDDDPSILLTLSTALRARGCEVLTAETGQVALDQVAAAAPQAVVLDLGLPDINGLEVCRRIRQWSDVPIVVLTAVGADEVKVRALDEGADDYVTKPYSTPELLARIRVALRHHGRATRHGFAEESQLVVGDLVVDLPGHDARVGGVRLDLTPKEFGFLAVLARHAGKVLTHRVILQAVWGEAYGTETQYLRVYASQLRKKLAGTGAPELVTEPGIGYRLVEAADRAVVEGGEDPD